VELFEEIRRPPDASRSTESPFEQPRGRYRDGKSRRGFLSVTSGSATGPGKSLRRATFEPANVKPAETCRRG
jgi:hypothetical protein